jgi:hypothetical protein
VLLAFSVVAALGILAHLGMLLWAQNSFTGPECVVAAQAMMLAHDGTLYYDLNRYPYTVAAYMPQFYWLEAGLYKLGLPIYTAGRLISFLALLGIFVLTWFLVLLYTRDRYYAWTGTLLCASSSLLLSWGTVGQVDTLAVFWGIAAFYQYSRYAAGGEGRDRRTLLWAGVFAALAFFTKQTMIACPLAIFVSLWFHRRKVAIQFGAGLGAFVLVTTLAINTALGGRFLADTVLANINPFSFDKMLQHLKFAAIAAGPLLLIAAAGFRPAQRAGARAPFLYLALAVTVFALTAAKVGSDLNYQIESTILLIVCACVALHSLDFFRLSLLGSKTWITLLQIPVALFLVVNYRITARQLVTRLAGEPAARAEIAALAPYLADGGRVLCADYNALVRLRGRIDFEMFIYHTMVDAGVVDPEPVRRDIAAGVFSTIVLMEDIDHPVPDLSGELSTLTPPQMKEVRSHYQLVEHIPGSVVYVYKPLHRNVSSAFPPATR